MTFRLVKPGRAENEEGTVVRMPGPMFRFEYARAGNEKKITLPCEFGESKQNEKAVLFRLLSPFCWDDGQEISEIDFQAIVPEIKEAIALFGFRAFFWFEEDKK